MERLQVKEQNYFKAKLDIFMRCVLFIFIFSGI